MLELRVKKLVEDAKLPTKAHITDAGFDLYSVEDVVLNSAETTKIDTGIAVEIPTGYVGVIFDRSSMGSKGIHRHGGIIDSSYRGPIMVCLNNTVASTQDLDVSNEDGTQYLELITRVNAYEIKKGDKIAQMLILPVPEVKVKEVSDLEESNRGEKGFGSSGR